MKKNNLKDYKDETSHHKHFLSFFSCLTPAKAAMAKPISVLAFLLLLLHSPPISTASKPKLDPVAADWPLQFHSVLFMNMSGTLQKIDLWYDWPNGRNFNIIQDQLGEFITYDIEWNNGTSFKYTLDPSDKECEVFHLPVGILRPNWLDGANYLGQEMVDNFLCNVWEKVDFIWYYEDVLTRRPVKWIFYSGTTTSCPHSTIDFIIIILKQFNFSIISSLSIFFHY